METDRFNICGCKGIRTCLKCEQLFGLTNENNCSSLKKKSSYFYCPDCGKCWPGWAAQDHNRHNGEPIILNGIYLQNNFLSPAEENQILDALGAIEWEPSQSGRRKQNFGPKCNFKKRKLRLGEFKGFPKSTKLVQDKFKDIKPMSDFQTIEQCSLEYDPLRGASIDPHIDDCWVWGERVVTVNLLADTVLTLTKYKGDKERYNLIFAPQLNNKSLNLDNVVIRIPMIRRSLFVMSAEARYEWEHQIFREDILEKRICLAYREFTQDYKPGGHKENEGVNILNAACTFC